MDAEIRRLVRTMAQDGWGARRIHAELTKLGFIISEITVSRYMPRRPTEPDQGRRWVTFLRNHKGQIAAMDLFTFLEEIKAVEAQLAPAFPARTAGSC